MREEARKPRAVKAEVLSADAKGYAVKVAYDSGFVARPMPVLRDAAERYEAGDALSKHAIYRNVFGLHFYLTIEEGEKAHVRGVIDAAIEAYEARAVLGAPAEALSSDEPTKPRPVRAGVTGEEKRHWLVKVTYENGYVAPAIQVAKRPIRRYEEGDGISERAVYRNVLGMHHYMKATEEQKAAVREVIDSAIAEHETRAARRAAGVPDP